MKYGSVSLKTKILTLVLIPFFISIYFFSWEVKEKLDVIAQADKIEEVSDLSVHISALVHELQRERGQTSGFLGSNGTLFKEELRNQHIETEKRVAELLAFTETFDSSEFDTPFVVAYQSAFSRLSTLESHRTAAETLSITGKENIDFYTVLIADLLKVVSQISHLSYDPQIAPTIAAYDHFLKGKEYTGIERALGTNAFALGSFETGNYEYFVSVIMTQDVHFSLFLEFADQDESTLFFEKKSDPSFIQTAEIRRTLLEKYSDGDLGVDSKQWYDLMTHRIDLLKEVENKISEDLIFKAATIKSEARRDLISFLGLALSAFLVLFVLGLTTIIRILNSIKLIQKGAETVRDGNLDYRINMKGSDELSELASSFDTMTEQVQQSIEDQKRFSGDLTLRVEEKTKELQTKVKELEALNKFMIGRELKMRELKKEISNCQPNEKA